jgi:hypothetical protein
MLDRMSAVVVSQHRYRPRPVLVAADLADLRGQATGMVELPLDLFWSAEQGRFNLDDPVSQAEMYRAVLRVARNLSDLTTYLDGDTLVRTWPTVSWRLPPTVRAAWEDQHEVLRESGRGHAGALPSAS